MTQQRSSLVLYSFLLAAVGCGGGSGSPVEAADPNAPPVVADQPPPLTSQSPVNAVNAPPDNSQAPPADPNAPPAPGAGGGSCVALCNDLPARDCRRPDQGCEQACAELVLGDCGPQLLALEVCALAIACPEQLQNQQQFQAVAAQCPSQTAAFVACSNAAGNNN